MAEGAFRIGSVVGRSITVLGKNIVPFGLLYLVINAPSALYALTHPVAAGRDTTSNMLAFAQTIVGMAATAAITYGTINELRGRRLSFSEFVRGGLAQGGAAIRVAILSGIGTLLGLIALVIPGIFFYTIWWVAVPVAVIERPGAFASLKRSAALTRGSGGSSSGSSSPSLWLPRSWPRFPLRSSAWRLPLSTVRGRRSTMA